MRYNFSILIAEVNFMNNILWKNIDNVEKRKSLEKEYNSTLSALGEFSSKINQTVPELNLSKAPNKHLCIKVYSPINRVLTTQTVASIANAYLGNYATGDTWRLVKKEADDIDSTCSDYLAWIEESIINIKSKQKSFTDQSFYNETLNNLEQKKIAFENFKSKELSRLVDESILSLLFLSHSVPSADKCLIGVSNKTEIERIQNYLTQLNEMMSIRNMGQKELNAVLVFIKSKMPFYFGTKFGSELNKLNVTLLNASSSFEIVDPTEAPNFTPIAELEKIGDASLGKEIKELQIQVYNLFDFGFKSEELLNEHRPCVMTLARLLDNEIQDFIKKIAKNGSKKADLETFKIRFIARLHSEDDNMQGHRTYFSFIHDLATALYRLVRKCTKKESGPFRLFSQTASEKQISDLDKNVAEKFNHPSTRNDVPEPPVRKRARRKSI